MSINTELTPGQMKEIITDIVKNNIELGKQGKDSVSLSIEGAPGIAKTSIIKQVWVENLKDSHYYVKESPSQKSVEDFLGYPFLALEMCKENEDCVWTATKMVNSYMLAGYKPTGNSRTEYAEPYWLSGKHDKPMVLVLDDSGRCSPMMQNALMELIHTQEFGNWKLPNGSSIIQTNNPSDGDFMGVIPEDSAQATRKLSFKMKPCVSSWAEWATFEGLDERLINFMDKHRMELIEKLEIDDKTNMPIPKGNLRIWTIYFTALGAYKSWGTGKDDDPIWTKMFLLGQNSLPVEHLILLQKFIKDGYDKIPTIDEILASDTAEIAIKVLNTFIEPKGQSRRQDLCSVISRRFLNHAVVHNKKYTKEMKEILFSILEADILSPDLVILILKKIQNLFPEFVKRTKLINKLMVF